MRWYDRTFPTVGQTLPYLKEAALEISSVKGVKDILTWGKLTQISAKPTAKIRDLNLLVKSSFDSEDLLAIDLTEGGPFSLKKEELELQGFNPRAVSFTKTYIKFANYNIDQWALSKDDKILHWGPVAETMEEWQKIRKDAEAYASTRTGISRKNLCKCSIEDRNKWKTLYEEDIQNLLCEPVIGWYSSEISPEEILKQSISLLTV